MTNSGITLTLPYDERTKYPQHVVTIYHVIPNNLIAPPTLMCSHIIKSPVKQSTYRPADQQQLPYVELTNLLQSRSNPKYGQTESVGGGFRTTWWSLVTLFCIKHTQSIICLVKLHLMPSEKNQFECLSTNINIVFGIILFYSEKEAHLLWAI